MTAVKATGGILNSFVLEKNPSSACLGVAKEDGGGCVRAGGGMGERSCSLVELQLNKKCMEWRV